MKKILLLSVFVLFSLFSLKAVNVTFRVDMNNETVLNNNVQVVIKNPWIWTALTDKGSGIWEATVTVDPNATYPYTFVNGGQDNWSGEEKIDGTCNFGSATAPERRVEVGTEDITVDLMAFGGCEIIIPSTVNVTFQVDMSNEDVLNNNVQVVIKNPWIWTTLTDQSNGIWKATVALEPNKTYPYTFVNGGQDNWSGEEKVEGACNFGSATAPERHVDVVTANKVIGLVAFGGCDILSSAKQLKFGTVNIFPNPCEADLTIQSDEMAIKSIHLYNIMGQEVIEKKLNGVYSTSFNTSKLQKGIYTIVINKNENYHQSRILVIK